MRTIINPPIKNDAGVPDTLCHGCGKQGKWPYFLMTTVGMDEAYCETCAALLVLGGIDDIHSLNPFECVTCNRMDEHVPF